MPNAGETSNRLQLNNLVQHLRLSYTREYTTSGLKHEEKHICKIFIKGKQYGHAMEGRTKESAFEAAAGTALTDLKAEYPSSS
ncbi:hypothetical protein D9619_013105 [Psilocybe cf. subviscida]|uniref:DRBM domain-containing protein n=1 Tax=Psilocybe cf. subviscida TaxID=2480587 RepID=A0A8H5AZJ0_9AGAR|nr:hypothetical protein D9619_013105 [Psilocybe cf. subviscida]